jgi:hypothetical protein
MKKTDLQNVDSEYFFVIGLIFIKIKKFIMA